MRCVVAETTSERVLCRNISAETENVTVKELTPLRSRAFCKIISKLA